jgi:hypothetical protein
MTATTRTALSDCPANWQDDHHYLYIGPTNRQLGLKAHPWLTTTHQPRPGEERADFLDRYQRILVNAIEKDTTFRDFLVDRAGRTLVCPCPPAGLCHGIVLAHVMEIARARQYMTDSIAAVTDMDTWRTATDMQIRKLTLLRHEEETLVAARGAQFREDVYLFPPDPEDKASMRNFFDRAHDITSPRGLRRVQS